MKNNDIIFFDFEATSKDANTAQPVQLAAIVIDGLELTVKPDSIFQSLIKPEFDLEKCKHYNLAPLTQESIDIHKKTPEMLKNAPSLKTVWSQFIEYVNCYNYQDNKWDKPIAAGKNIIKYDLPICRRIASQEPYKFGPWNKEKNEMQLFQVRDEFDIEHDVLRWFKFQKDQKSYSMDNLRPLLGIPTDGAHDALDDVIYGAFLLCKFLNVYKTFCPKLKMANSFETSGTNLEIKRILDTYATKNRR